MSTENMGLEVINAYNYLATTDYVANKIIEYQFMNKQIDEDYTEILSKREEAREIIRKFKENFEVK